MDDEEEDISLQHPASSFWGNPFRDIKFHTRDRDSRGARDTRDRGDTQDRSTQMSTGPNAMVPRSEGHHIMVPQGHNYTVPCGVRDNHQARMLLHGNAGFCLHFPARFEPMDDQGERQNDEGDGRREDDDEEERRRMEERPDEERVEDSTEDSTEVRIGRKLREIGDQFHQDHVQLFLRHQRDFLPVWIRLTMALYGFLFNRGPPAIPRLRGQER